jgi:hypothetical protein
MIQTSQIAKQVFFSHTWKPDKLGRNNHNRVKALVDLMIIKGWDVWFDEYNMMGNIDASMADGIDACDCILICLTEEYCKKINETARNPRQRDNCLNEWTYSCTRNKLMIPIIMEPHMLDPKQWPAGIVPLYLGSTLYIDASYDRLINNCILLLTKMLITYKIFPSRFPYIKRKMLPIKERIRRSKNRDKNMVTQVRI